MDEKDKKNITNKENITEGNLETTSKQSEITNDDGSITYISQITEKKTGTGIISDPQKVEEISLGVSAEDTKYVEAIRAKKELGVLFNDKLLTYITVNAFENILKLMDENLENYFDALSFGIYSYQEILELKNSIKTIEIEKKENIIKYFEVYSEENKNKLNHFTNLNDDIFKSVDKQFEIIKEAGVPVTTHQPSFSTCIKPKTNGVLRPKTFTMTVSFFFSLLISSIVPENPLNGPSVTLTVSPTTKGISPSPSASSSTVPRSRLISA